MPDMLSNREGPQARAPSKCLNRWTYVERLTRGRLFARLEARRGSKKDSNRAITPAAVHFPANLAPSASLQAKQLRHLRAQISLGQSCHRPKKSCVYACRVASVLSKPLQPCRVACQASLSGRGVLQARILERIGQYWLPYPSRALYFLLL